MTIFQHLFKLYTRRNPWLVWIPLWKAVHVRTANIMVSVDPAQYYIICTVECLYQSVLDGAEYISNSLLALAM